MALETAWVRAPPTEAIPFSLLDGTSGIIAPEARKVYDHIVRFHVGDFPSNGLEGPRLQAILERSKLSENELENIWQGTEVIDAVPLPEDCWSQLEVYIVLNFVQASERLSLNQMAIQFAGSLPSEPRGPARKKSTYAQARLSNRVQIQHDPLPSPPSPALTEFVRHSYSNATATTREALPPLPDGSSNQDENSVSQPGLETLELSHPNLIHNLGRGTHTGSHRTDTTSGAQRLNILVRSRCPVVRREPDIERAQPSITVGTLDRIAAQELLVRNRRADPHFKSPSKKLKNRLRSAETKSKKDDSENWQFKPHELSQALREAIGVPGNAGTARALIDRDADVHSSHQLRTATLGSHTESTPINYLELAVNIQDSEMVAMLGASGVSSTMLAEALKQAVERGLTRITLTLLQFNVDPNAYQGSIFKAAVASQNVALVKLLLRSRLKVRAEFLSQALIMAVDQGHPDLASLLVKYGADVGFQDALSLKKAVQAQDITMVLLLLDGVPSTTQGRLASSVIESAFSTSSPLNPEEKFLLIEILLCAGAGGDPVARLLVAIVRAGHRPIAKLLIKYGANLRYNNHEALKLAVSSRKSELLSTLLDGRTTEEMVSAIVDHIPVTCSDNEMYAMLVLLTTRGATGSPLDRALVQAVQNKYQKSAGLLLDRHARIEAQNSQSLRIATTGGDVAMLSMLVNKGQPSSDLLQQLLPLIPQVPTSINLEMTDLIIHAAGRHGLAPSALNEALFRNLGNSHLVQDHNLIPLVQILLSAGASPDHQRGRCFQLVAETKSIDLLDIFISQTSDPGSMCPAVPVFMRMADPNQRSLLLRLLLRKGARGLEVNQALIEAVGEQPPNIPIIQSLLQNADLDFQDGEVLLAAVQYASSDIVKMIIAVRTTLKSRGRAAKCLFTQNPPDRVQKISILLDTDPHQKSLDDGLIQEIQGAKDIHVVKMLIDHKASCEWRDGKALKLAIQRQDLQLLSCLVREKPNPQIVSSSIRETAAISSAASRLECLRLLIQGGAIGTPMNEALLREVETPDKRHYGIMQLLVDGGAAADYAGGKILKFAVSTPLALEILTILLSRGAPSGILAELVPLAMRHEESERIPLLQVILEKGACGPCVDAALIQAVSEGPAAKSTMDLLFSFNASVNYDEAEAVKVAAYAGSDMLLGFLLDKGPNPAYLDGLLELAMRSVPDDSSVTRLNRLRCVQLSNEYHPAQSSSINNSLVQAAEERDHDLLKYLVSAGGDPNFLVGRCLAVVAENLDVRALEILLRAKSKFPFLPQSLTNAFDAIPQDDSRWNIDSACIQFFDETLLRAGVSGTAIDGVFASALRSSSASATKFIVVILECGTPLDPAYDQDESFCLVTREACLDVVAHFLAQGPSDNTLRKAFLAMLKSKAEEDILLQLTSLFFHHRNEEKQIYFQYHNPGSDALYQVLKDHPDKPKLLRTFMENGCEVKSKFYWTFDATLGPEQTSALLWLLCPRETTVNSETVKTLIDHKADCNFRTLTSHITPLMMAVCSANANAASQLLTAGAEPNIQDSGLRTPLLYATIRKDKACIERLLQYQANTDDESLHAAARGLDHTAVQLLLEHGADPDLLGTTHCGSRTPLGEMCVKADMRDDPSQAQKVMQMLYEGMKKPRVLVDGKSLLFLALGNIHSALYMVRGLLKTCASLKNDINNEYNLYSKQSRRYSPTAYVRHFKCRQTRNHRSFDLQRRCCTLDGCPAPELESVLRAHGCKNRFWDEGKGADQPLGYCDPPESIKAAIRVADVEREERNRQARERAEQKRLRDEAEQEERERAARRARQKDQENADEIRREHERAWAIKEKQAAQTRATQQQAQDEAWAIAKRAAAEENVIRVLNQARADGSRAEADQERREYEMKRQRSLDEFREQQRRDKVQRDDEVRVLRDKTNILTNQKRQEADIQSRLMAENRRKLEDQKKVIKGLTDMAKEAGNAGVNPRLIEGVQGRILGEIS